MSGAETPAVDDAPPKAVSVADIERELNELLRQPIGPDGQEMINWACMSNLIIYCATEEQFNRVTAEIGLIVRHHPARVLVLVGDATKAGDQLEAYVSAACHILGGGRKSCSEYVTLSAGGPATRRLPNMVRSLLIGDLPTDLWWSHNEPPPAGGDLFNELAGMSNQIIYESVSWPSPVKSVVTMAQWAANPDSSLTISDLGWRRLKPWRRILGQSLDPGVTPEALESITEVIFDHGPHTLQQVWLLVGWLACRLNWKPLGGKVVPGEALTWRFQSPRGTVSITAKRHSELSPEIHRMALNWKSAGKTHTADFAVAGPNRLAVTMKDPDMPPRYLLSPYQSRAELIAKQLPDRGRDELFDQTLQLSRQMAESMG